MADSRMIRIGFLDSDRVTALSWRAECFFHRLLLVADDYGLFDARLSVLRTRLFPLCLDKVREADLQRDLAECEGAGLVRLYEAQGKPYLEILNYGQRCQSKPKYPLPNTVSRGDSPCVTVVHSGSPGFTAKTESETNKENKVESSSTVASGAVSTPPTLDDGFNAFLSRIKPLYPTWAKFRKLPADCKQPAIDAYGTVTLADADYELLAAYYASTMPKDRYGVAFWRPAGLKMFLEGLPDVLSHAYRWRKEVGWGFKPKAAPAPKVEDEEPGDVDSFRVFMEGGEDGTA